MSTGPTIAAADAPLDVLACPLSGVQLIEASAGTGKTWNICALVLRLLLEKGLAIEQILVVTFTTAATAELKERVRQRIAQGLQLLALPVAQREQADPLLAGLLHAAAAAQGVQPEALAAPLDLALQSFDQAAIFTIHGFCQRALADAPFSAQLPLDLEPFSDDSSYREQAVNDFWRQHVMAGTADPELVRHLVRRQDSPARWAQLLKRQAAKPLSRLLWPQDIDDDLACTPDRALIQSRHAAMATLWPAQRAQALALLQGALSGKALNGRAYTAAGVQACMAAWDRLMADPLPPHGVADLPAKADLLGQTRLRQSVNKDKTAPDHPLFDRAQDLIDALTAADRALDLKRLRLIRQLIAEGLQAMREAKLRQHVVAFDDMLQNLHRRLVSPEGAGLAATLAQRFPTALIDEFQDTDPVQWAVFSRIYQATPGPLFLVGDPKQAIYSFRHADLHTYLAARQQASHRHTLVHNQRASAGLIQALNRLWGLNPQVFMQAGLHYIPVALGAKPRSLWRDDSGPGAALQVWTLPANAAGQPMLMRADALAQAAQACASDIARLLQAAQGGQVSIDGKALGAGQIAVLVRSRAQGQRMRQALQTVGVGSVEIAQASVFQSTDAQELARVLAAMIEPARTSLLKAAMATRWLGASATDIHTLLDDEARLMDAMSRLNRARDAWQRRGIGFMLRQWLHDERVPQRLLAQPDGARRLTNFLHLAECLHQAAAEHPSPQALLRWLQGQIAQGDALDEATQLRLESDQNLVQIVTIHRSKGLEYPVVYCPFLFDGYARSGGDKLDGWAGHDEQGQAVVDFRADLDPDFDEQALKDQQRLEDAAEQMRLFYVALTRAVHRCTIVAGSYFSKHGKSRSTAESSRSLLNWMVLGLDGNAPGWLGAKSDALPSPATVMAAWQGLTAVPGLPPGSLSVGPWPAASGIVLSPDAVDPARLSALVPPQPLPLGWRIGSYSALAHAAVHERAAQDHDLRADTVDATPTPAQPPDWVCAPDDILLFPRGAAAGDCVHAALEWADFSRPATWPEAAAKAWATHKSALAGQIGLQDDARCTAMLTTMLHQVLGCELPLPGVAPLSWPAVPAAKRLAELEFHLAAPRLQAADLNLALRRWGYAMPSLGFATQRGFLKGFIDLVFEHDGRYYIADWKSNHLGDHPAAYGPVAVERAMAQSGYHLQHLIYALALHRWLGQRLPHYNHARHFGGALYLFVRGVRPQSLDAQGWPTGVYFHRASLATLDELSQLMGGDSA